MRKAFVRRSVLVLVLVLVPVLASAQDATISGTVTDATGSALPGVTVTSVLTDTGNKFIAVTDASGAYRIPVRIGTHSITAELQGFTTASRQDVVVQVGQVAVVNLQLGVSGVQETVTVSGEAPLIDITQSKVGTNIDRKQMEELPVNGRNWLGLVTMAQGSRVTAPSVAPVTGGQPGSTHQTAYQVNVDGQQVTQTHNATLSGGQPSYSRDAIAEFEVIANRFDATQGRSNGLIVNAITKSGTNRFAGTVAGYFRDDAMNAKDFVAQRVLPYSNQQFSFTFGGPVRRDRAHFFGSYEYERTPQTLTWQTPFPSYNGSVSTTEAQHKVLGRGDIQLSSSLRAMVRGQYWDHNGKFDSAASATTTPLHLRIGRSTSNQLFGGLTHVIGNSLVHEVRGGYGTILFGQRLRNTWPNSGVGAHPSGLWEAGNGMPSIQFSNLTIGPGVFTPFSIQQNSYSVRDDLAYSFTKSGQHTLKLGGEYLHTPFEIFVCNRCNPFYIATGPAPANVEQLFPFPFSADHFRIDAISSQIAAIQIAVGDARANMRPHMFAGWFQDDWRVSSRLTLNLGLRWDLQVGAFAENMPETFLPPFQVDRPSEKDDFAPRLGFAYQLTDRTVLRGGGGKFFSQNGGFNAYGASNNATLVIQSIPNDGRPDFAVNPFNGPAPTFEQAAARAAATGTRALATNFAAPGNHMPYAWQGGLGVQRQLGATMAVNGDYVYTGTRNDNNLRNINLTYNPATGANFPLTDRASRVDPRFGPVAANVAEGYSNYHALQLGFTKRFSQRWQSSGNYTWSALRDGVPSPAPFAVAEDIGGYYTRSATDAPHRLVLNGVWEVGGGFQVSGLYMGVSGERYITTWGGHLRNNGNIGTDRLRPNGTIVPRNNFVGDPIHRVDLRLQQRMPLAGTARLEGILEVYNVFNHANYGSYNTAESSPFYGRPTQNLNVAYAPRMLQLGFRLTF